MNIYPVQGGMFKNVVGYGNPKAQSVLLNKNEDINGNPMLYHGSHHHNTIEGINKDRLN